MTRGLEYDLPPRPRRPRLSDEVAAYVREQIVSGVLAAGDFVRPERVAEQVGVSATPAREGLLALQAEGFLEVVPRRGFAVIGLSAEDVEDTFVAQALLAGELAARAARRMPVAEVDALRALQSRIDASAGDGDLAQVQQLNDQFHRSIYLRAAAPRLIWLLRQTLGYAPRLLWDRIEGWPDLTVQDHVAVLDALAAGDEDAAREAMHRHLTNAGSALAARVRAVGGDAARARPAAQGT